MATASPNNRSSELSKHGEDFRAKVSDLGKGAQELTKITKRLAGDTVRFVSKNASNYYRQGLEKAHQVEKGVENRIKTRPLQSILVATGIGLILGVLWKKR